MFRSAILSASRAACSSQARLTPARALRPVRLPQSLSVPVWTQNTASAIECWKGALELQPSADCHTNLASAYILSQPPQPALAIRHLKDALSMSPDDPEIAYNLAACLESTGALEPALKLYERSKSGGIDRAEQNIRNIKAKILGAKAGSSAET